MGDVSAVMVGVCCCGRWRSDRHPQFADCFGDFRKPQLVEHRVAELVGQRVYGLALGLRRPQ